MNILIEGVDCVGKDTQIRFLETEFEKLGKVVHIIHYSNIKLENNENIEIASKLRYREMFNLLNKSDDLNIFIFNRSHLGEMIYGPIYRNYSGNYVLDFEKDFMKNEHQDTKLILFTDDAEAIIKRDKERNDGQSFSLDPEIKKKEIELFDNAFEKSILNKKRIKLEGRDAEQIWGEEVKPFIFS